MSTRLDPEQEFICEAGRIAAHGPRSTPEDLQRLKRAMDGARPCMTDEIRIRIFDHCAALLRDGVTEDGATALLGMLHERIVQLTSERGPWYVKRELVG